MSWIVQNVIQACFILCLVSLHARIFTLIMSSVSERSEKKASAEHGEISISLRGENVPAPRKSMTSLKPWRDGFLSHHHHHIFLHPLFFSQERKASFSSSSFSPHFHNNRLTPYYFHIIEFRRENPTPPRFPVVSDFLENFLVFFYLLAFSQHLSVPIVLVVVVVW